MGGVTVKISYYPTVINSDSQALADVSDILHNIKAGLYQDHVLKVRTAKDDDERKRLKNKAPAVTISGQFSHRKSENLIRHSGLIAIDFDNLDDYGDTFNLLINDPYSYSVFMSISGRGICALVKIDGKRHLDAFLGLEKYYYVTYGLQLDRSCKDVARPRYLSYDPDLYVNENSEVFKQYLPKHKPNKKFNNIHYNTKFEKILQRINHDITDDYNDWIKLGFAIASEYGENGFDYFRHISQFSPKFDEIKCEKKYRTLLGDKPGGITIASFYEVCKNHGIDITDENEKLNREIARKLKSAGKTEKDAIKEIPNAIPEVIADEFQAIAPVRNNQLNIEAVEIWLQSNYDIKKNELTRFYELNGSQLESQDLNSIYIHAKKLFPKLSRDILESLIFSNFTPSYNPVVEYLEALKWDGKDRIAELTHVITSDTGDFAYRMYGLQYWLCGIVDSAINGIPNVLCLILAGKQNTGKSTFFTRLLPGKLSAYFSTSQLDRGKDDEILMCQSLIIFDDEFSGKSKQDAKHMKRMLSAGSFTLREPYGRQNVTLKRIATLCGTCNELDVLNDPTGNRRFVVFNVTNEFNYKLYNEIDKEQLFAQCVSLVKSGEHTKYYKDFLMDLQSMSNEFMEVSIEQELLDEFFLPNELGTFYLASMIKDTIESNSEQKLNVKRLSAALDKLGFKRVKHNQRYGYMVSTKRYVG